MDIRSIPIDQIDTSEKLYYLPNYQSTLPEDSKLEFLYNPIWLQETSSTDYRIVDGFKILGLASNTKPNSELPALIFPAQYDIQELWLLRIKKRLSENNLAAYSVLESLENVLNHIKEDIPGIQLSSFISKLGIPKSKLERTQLNRMNAKIITYGDFCDLPELSFRDLNNLLNRTDTNLKVISEILAGLKLKGNKLISLLQLVDELEKGFQISPKSLLQEKELIEILEERPVQSRYKDIKSFLLSLRWPVLKETQENWNRISKRFSVPDQQFISVDPHFEHNEIDFSFKAADLADYKEKLKLLTQYAADPEFASLFNFV